MDEDIAIIDTKTRNEKIKNFFVEKKKLIISTITFIVVVILSFYSYQIYKNGRIEQLSDKFNDAVIEHKNGNKLKVTSSMKQVVEDKDSTYSPLALYFLIDNNLLENKSEINGLFDILINDTNLEKEIKNLIIYKKALFIADYADENQLLGELKPLLNSESVWKSHALYLLAEFFYYKNEQQKSKEFFVQILNTENANQDIIKMAQKRLNRDLSD